MEPLAMIHIPLSDRVVFDTTPRKVHDEATSNHH